MAFFRNICLILLLLLLTPGVGLAQGGGNPADSVAFDQKLGDQIPLDLAFIDAEGQAVTLGQYFAEQPVVLIMGYYECPMLCSLVREGAVQALQQVRLNVGQDFQVINVSIDPLETPMAAANARNIAISRYNRPDTDDGWHFLTGSQDNIAQLADAIGFQYYYDETIDQYAHAAGIVVATPQGELSHYFYGIEFNPSDLRLGLVEASNRTIGTPVDQLLLLCYHYNPITGQYTGLVMMIVRAAGVLTMLFIGLLIFFLSRGSGGSGRPGTPIGATG
ncbi:MAG: SCO family protein [Oscillochloris sp.]|nr:SCO family protein [Oscillochloris sp.]